MKKVASITCLLLLTVGSAAAWAGVCCPVNHDVKMTSAEDCLAPASRVAPTTVGAEPSGNQRLHAGAGALTDTAPAPSHSHRAVCASEHPPGGTSPAAAQTTPVLLR